MLISEGGAVKLSGFDIYTDLDKQNSKRECTGCSSWDTAPEVVNESSYVMDDVWSLGISIIEMAEGKHPFVGMTSASIVNRVLNSPSPTLSSSGWSSDLIDLVRRCLVKDVNERASVEELLRVGVSSVSLDVAPVRARRGGANRGGWELCRPVGAGKTCGERVCE